MARFAEGTTVTPEKTQGDILTVLRKYGATGFMFGQDEDGDLGMVAFKSHGRMVRFELPLRVDRAQFRQTASYQTRSTTQVDAKVAAEIRRRWRALYLAIKAKLEVVETGIASFEDEFLAHIVLPDGSTVGRWVRPQLEAAYESNEMPRLLPGTGPKEITSG